MSALRSGRLYPQGDIPGTAFCYEAESPPPPQGRSAAGRIMSMKNPSYPVGVRNRGPPAWSEYLIQLHHRVPGIKNRVTNKGPSDTQCCSEPS